jgi:hypothetical protein
MTEPRTAARDLLMEAASVGYTYGALGRDFAQVLPELERLQGAEASSPDSEALALRRLDHALYMLDAWVVHHPRCTVITNGTRSEISGGYRWTPGDACSCGLENAQADLAAARAAATEKQL